MSQPWSVPGYEVQSLLGRGGTGEVWRAVDVATGEPVALKRMRSGAGADAVRALRREAAVLRRMDTPYVVRLRQVVDDGPATVLVLDLAEGGSLTALLARRGALDAGEVVTVAAPIAAALAAAHARGLVHGDVSPSNVLFSRDGMPLLADLGMATFGTDADRLDDRLDGGRLDDDPLGGTAEYLDPAVAAGSAPTPASDVWALSAVCHHMLAGSPPHEGDEVGDVLAAAADGGRAPLGLLAPTAPRLLVEAVEAGLAPDPATRPDAAAFAALLRRAHAAAPVRFDGAPAAASVPSVRPTHAVPRHAAVPPERPTAWRPPRWLVPAVAGAALLIGAATLGWWLGRGPAPPAAAPLASAASQESGTSTSTPVAAADTRAPEWGAVLDGLDAARAEAFATADAGLLSGVYAVGSPGLAADTALVERLTSSARTARGVRHEVRAVEVQQVSATSARLRVVDVLSAYELVAVDGSVASRIPPRGATAFVVDLTLTPGGWRLVQVAPA